MIKSREIQIEHSEYNNRRRSQVKKNTKLQQSLNYINPNLREFTNNNFRERKSFTLAKLNKTWRKNGLVILLFIQKTIEKLKKISQTYIFRRMNKKQFKILGDQSIDFDFYDQNTLYQNLTLFEKIQLMDCTVRFMNKMQKIIRKIIIHPESPLQLIWDGIVLIVLFLNLIYIPIQIAFNIDEGEVIQGRVTNRLPETMYIFVNDIPTFIFIFDIAIGSVTSYYFKGFLIRQKTRIVQHYLQTDFFWDVIAIMPFFLKRWIQSRYLGMLLVLRLTQVFQILQNFEENLSLRDGKAAAYDFLKLLITIIFMAHFCGCIFYFVHTLEVEHGAENSWVITENIDKLSWEQQYIVSLYWGVITMITVGYGDIVPITVMEKLVAVGLTLISCGVFAYAVNQIGIIFQEIRQRDKSYQKKFNNINEYLQGRGLSHQLLMKVQRYCQYLHVENAHSIQQSEHFLNTELNSSLRNQVRTDINLRQMEKHKIFKLIFSQQFKNALAPHLYERIYGPHEKLINHRSGNTKLFFILTGDAWMYLPISGNQTEKIMKLHPNQLVGVNSFFSQEQSDIGVVARDVLRVMVLDFETFINVLKNHSEDYQMYFKIRDDLKHYGRSRGLDCKCEACDSFAHGIGKCPLIHFGVQSQMYIIQNLKQEKTLTRTQFDRGDNRRELFNHSRKRMKQYAIMAIKFIVEEGIRLEVEDNLIMNCISNIQNANGIKENEIAQYQEFKNNDQFMNQTVQNNSIGSIQNESQRSEFEKSQSDQLIQIQPDEIREEKGKNELSVEENQNGNGERQFDQQMGSFKGENLDDSDNEGIKDLSQNLSDIKVSITIVGDTSRRNFSQPNLQQIQLTSPNQILNPDQQKQKQEIFQKLRSFQCSQEQQQGDGEVQMRKNSSNNKSQNLKDSDQIAELRDQMKSRPGSLISPTSEQEAEKRELGLLRINNELQDGAQEDGQEYLQRRESSRDVMIEKTINQKISKFFYRDEFQSNQNNTIESKVTMDIDQVCQYANYYPEKNISQVLQKIDRDRNSFLEQYNITKDGKVVNKEILGTKLKSVDINEKRQSKIMDQINKYKAIESHNSKKHTKTEIRGSISSAANQIESDIKILEHLRGDDSSEDKQQSSRDSGDDQHHSKIKQEIKMSQYEEHDIIAANQLLAESKNSSFRVDSPPAPGSKQVTFFVNPDE